LGARWGAVAIAIQIYKDNPRRIPRGIGVAVYGLQQEPLSFSAVNRSNGHSDVIEYPAQQGFVQIPLYGRCDDRPHIREHGLNSKERELLRFRRPRLGKQRVGQGYTTLDQCLGLSEIGRDLNTRAFRSRFEEQHFVQSDPFVTKQVGRMGANKHLSPGASLHPREHLRQETNHVGMQRKLGFLEQERSRLVKDGPQKPEKPQRAIGKLLFRLPSALRPPMFVSAAKVGSSYFVSEILKFLKLRYGDFQGFADLPQTCIASAVRRTRDLLQEIRTERVLSAPDVTVRFPNQLGNEVKITNRLEEL
jgi:hypothetical protein